MSFFNLMNVTRIQRNLKMSEVISSDSINNWSTTYETNVHPLSQLMEHLHYIK